ncbi:MAG: phosphate/phosphite/phosphonate ABC transporter substrate-binding protein [SAR324 cluster bacterium]|nr:phosphate/phosphite/phosphonate ABC transporter substrate-binding protein [SAR324 cluster bacterium]
MKPYHLAIYLILLAFFVTVASPIQAASKVYKVGVVPQFDVRKIQAIWQPILTELEKKTNLKLVLVPSNDIPDFERQFLKGEFDLLYLNPYHLLVAKKHQSYYPILRDHGRMLYGVLTAAKNGKINKVEDLEGKVIAFPAPNALGASLLIRASLKQKFGIKFTPRYVKSHSSVYLNVTLGIVAAGGGVQKTLMQQPAEIRDSLKVIYKTQKVAPHPIAMHPRVKKADARAITEALLKMGSSPLGKRLLLKIPIKKIGPAKLEDYSPLMDLGIDQFYVK